MLLLTIIVSAHIAKIDVTDLVRRRLYRFPVSADNPVPPIAITRIGKQPNRDVVIRPESDSGKRFTQRTALAVELTESPEGCWRIDWFDRIRYLVKQVIHVHLVEKDSLSRNLRSQDLVLHPDANLRVQTLKLATAF